MTARWTFIDWDLAAPGRRSWDVSWALLSLVPLMPGTGLTDTETLHRIGVFRESYGADAFPADILSVALERCEHEAERISRLGAAGEEPYERLLAEGHYDTWRSAAEHVRASCSSLATSRRGFLVMRQPGRLAGLHSHR